MAIRGRKPKVEQSWQGEILPTLASPSAVEHHTRAVLLRTSDSFRLKILAAKPKIARHLLGFLSDTVALVEPASAAQLAAELKREGETFTLSGDAS